MSDTKKQSAVARIVLTVLVGAFIGVGAILPGLSGGVMCVVFGIYQPLMETLSHPFVGVKKHWRLLLPTVIGIGIGFVGFAKILEMLKINDLVLQCIFLGLVLGTIPALWKEAGETKRTKASWVTLCISFAVMLLILGFFGSLAKSNPEIESTQMARLLGGAYPKVNFSVSGNGGWIMVGVFFALSMIMPGMSFSSPLLCLGLFDPMKEKLAQLATLDLSGGMGQFILFVGIGGLATVVLFSKPMNLLFEKKPSVGYHLVMGSVFASTLLLIPIKFDGALHAVCCVVAVVGGFAVGYLLDKVQSKIKADRA